MKIFEDDEEVVLEAAIELCKVLQARHYFTDTATFTFKCNVCGHLGVGGTYNSEPLLPLSHACLTHNSCFVSKVKFLLLTLVLPPHEIFLIETR